VEILLIFIFTQMKQINTNNVCIKTAINVQLKPLFTQLMQLKKIIAQSTALTDTGIYMTLMKQDLSLEVRSEAICLCLAEKELTLQKYYKWLTQDMCSEEIMAQMLF